MKWIRWVIAATLLLALGLGLSCANTARHKGPPSEHFDGKRFHNSRAFDKTLMDLVRWRMNRVPGNWQYRELQHGQSVPVARVTGPQLATTMVNHATILLQTAGLNILTDPIWSERASPLGWLGPRRFSPPGVAFAELPPIHAVVISHNHFDHMDIPTLQRLAAEHRPLFIVPLGNGHYLQQAGIRPVVELDWWETLELSPQLQVNAVPSQHWSRRGLLDLNRALWAGYVFQSTWGTIYFAGDTGMADHFAQIRERFGDIDLALLPVGSYLPRWFMQDQHIDPEELISAHLLLGARSSLAIHYGTFPLADDGQDQPVNELRLSLEKSLPSPDIQIPFNGDRLWYARRSARQDAMLRAEAPASD